MLAVATVSLASAALCGGVLAGKVHQNRISDEERAEWDQMDTLNDFGISNDRGPSSHQQSMISVQRAARAILWAAWHLRVIQFSFRDNWYVKLVREAAVRSKYRYRGRRLPSAKRLLTSDQRPPVLYLRSFVDDQLVGTSARGS